MAGFLGFFIRLAPLVFLVLALGLMFGLRRMAQARNEIRGAAYGLEREIARNHMVQASSALVLVGLLALAEFILVVFLVPNIPALSLLATPTMNPLSTPTSTFPLELMETLGVATPGSTPTIQSSGCIPGQIDITSPASGSEINGSVMLKGTANIPNFGFYKYEFSPQGSDNWAAVLASRQSVRDDELGNWDTTAIATGDYYLRLVVTDNQGNELPACVIAIRIKAP